ncbi:uncharacterized protein [Coffea arabica]|uniref:Uncharacterized protein isoform X2 n=1 Tax=Coffea arabica TaxID=13443 RepID=A0A6P6VSC8_COFAR|nr:uncharacterized protein LOC113726159 isoform X2 [Coffea arabica]
MPMDSVVHSAIEEICSQGGGGLSLLNLWPRLHQSLSAHGLPLCPNVKAALWSNLLNVPGLRFEVEGDVCDCQDALINSLEKCEQMNMKIVASERLRSNFIGITDIEASDSKINEKHRRTLERLAIARTSGVTQSELAKEFGIKGKDIFYILKALECRGLILKQTTVVKTKEACDEGHKKTISNVATNMLHLYRYGKQLGYQQRLEIIKENIPLVDSDVADVTAANSAGFPKGLVKEDVNVKDYLPALKAICDKLEQADGKVLVVSDLKQDLGYRGTSGHRAWRNEVKCLQLLKKFSPKHFEPKLSRQGYDELDVEQTTKLGKRGQITDQLVELPIDHQIYDMIDAEGSKGLTFTEVCRRLGICNKQYYDRLLDMYPRFGMHLQAESCKRSYVYRFWTSRNFNSEASDIIPCDTAMVMHENTESVPQPVVWETDDSFIPTIQEVDSSTYKDVADDAPVNEPEVCYNSTTNAEDNLMLLTPNNPQSPASEASGRVPDMELGIVNTTASNGTINNISPPVPVPMRRRSYQKYPCLALGAASALREQRILQLLKEEKFLIKAELHRRLEIENLEKEKSSMMDRRTLARSLNKLQEEGQCRCVPIHMPAISNCSASRTIEVVLHPSISNLSDQVLSQIQERHRLFEIQIRRQCYSRMKKGQSTPVLDSVQRIQTSVHSDTQAEQAEARLANGYVLAKMVRTKLLHIFLWNYLRGSHGWNDPLSIEKNGHDMRNPHSTSKMFGLDAAIKAMPLELFLQVVGSTQKFENLIEKCRMGLRLSDLPVEEYRCLMDTQATGRLSRLIDILLRLKLIRLVRAGHSDGEAKVQDITTLVHALELKPYIEEPVSIVASTCGFIFPDLRPHVRHDFVLSTRKVVDEYWNTLEYCYSAADSKAALHAFPGSAVHEIFFPRSWASARVMTVDQRAELLKRVVTDEPHKKLSYGECREIANDLNLTVEQVLRVYQGKRQKRFTSFGGDSYARGNEFDPLRHTSSSSARKRKRSFKGKSPKHAKSETKGGYWSKGRLAQISDTEREDTFITSLGDYGSHLLEERINDQMQAVEQQESNEENEHDQFFIHKYALSKLKTGRQNRFSWTEEADRQLVIEYVRNRALLGAKYHRTDWGSLSNLPAPPETCRRRMAMLNSTPQFRKAVLRLCNMLAERYEKYLEKYQKNSLNLDDGRPLVREAMMVGDCNENLFDCFEHGKELKSHIRWDNFDDCNIKIALDDVLRYKTIAKSNTSKQVDSYEWSHGQDPFNTDKVCQERQICGGRSTNSAQRSSSYRIVQKYNKLLNEGNTTSRRIYGSVAVSNAAELFKLIFLSTSITPQASILLAETLRRYSQHDLFAAFSYLREKKIMIGGNATSPFALSQHFLHSISLSPFPPNAGKRASKFASWLDRREKDLIEEEIQLPADLQCGDIFHLCGLISLGELSITPCLPEDGIGEAEDSRTSKRKNDTSEYCGDKSKRLKTSMPGEGEIICRREKGFPGIRLSLSRVTVPRMCFLELFKDKDSTGVSLFCDKDQCNSPCPQSGGTSSLSDECTFLNEVKYDLGINCTATAAHKSPWESMTSYADHLVSSFHDGENSPFHTELFRTICSAIQKSGDQGLSMEEIANLLNIAGEKELEIVVDVLEAFGRAFKVSAYDAIHVVDSLYRSKYFLASVAESNQNPQVTPSVDSKGTSHEEHKLINVGSQEDDVGLQDEISTDTDDVHKITILNHPKELTEPLSVIQRSNEVEDHAHSEVISSEVNPRGDMFEVRSCDPFVYPILPWINGDGTINELVYKGLVRRILGIVMQNPGILRDDIIKQMGALNPQSCRKLLEKLIQDKHIIVRRMHQTTCPEPPAILRSLLGSCTKKSKLVYREHLFANPMSTALL